MSELRLHRLTWTARAGLTSLLLVIGLGLAASAAHVVLHHENRDERAGLSMHDLRGAYHGVRTTAPLVAALERSHPPELPDDERQALLGWLRGDRLGELYDSLDLGDRAPAEVLQRRCVGCHARSADAGAGIGARVPLEYWDDVRALAVARDVAPVAPEILIASAHTHALAMGSLSIVLGLLALCSRWPRGLVGGALLLCGIGLLCDIGAWLPARGAAALVWVIAAAGALWLGATALLLALVLLELWWPERTGAAP